MRRLSLLLALTAAILGASASAASAQIAFAPCSDAGFEAFGCATLPQPLDRTGAVPGQVNLFVRRLLTPSGVQAKTALVALAGGPGQAASPSARSFATALAPALASRDLLVYDQRGTGRSGTLQCGALLGGRSTRTITRCARQLGPTRGLYRTSDSVEDLEALRVAAGYEKLAFYGVSYGTKVALDYAAKHPGNVERLVLDSVVPPEGPDALQRSSFRSVRGVLGELCAGTRCRGITQSPVGDIRTLIRRNRDIRGSVVSASGRRQNVRIPPTVIYDMLVAGDLNPAWRAQFPGAVRAAVRGDGAPLARLALASAGGGGSSARFQRVEDPGVNSALFLATICEEARFPWNRASSTNGRAGQAIAALGREPGDTWSPFSRLTAAGSGILGTCLGWPNATPPPAAPIPLPAVPTLIVNGAADLRTPASDAAAIAGRIPGTQLVTVPNVGHSVLGLDPSGCARAAIAGFFNGNGATACPAAEPAVAPVARPVRSISQLPRTGRLAGRVGRTMTAVLRTQEDVLVQALGERLQGARHRFGGLRGGTITQTASAVSLRDVVVVPGVAVSGRFPDQGDARLTIRGGSAARGTLTIARDGRITGRLGGKNVALVPRARQASRRPALKVPYPDLVRAGS